MYKIFAFTISLLINISIFCDGFLPGTLVKTRNGYESIEKLNENEIVESFDFKNKQLVDGRINRIQKIHYQSYYKLRINGNDICVSPDHQFYCPISEKNRWVKTKDLKEGDFILSNLSQCLRIEKIEKITQEADFYCLSIDQFHNYFISEQNIFVHNYAFVLGALGNFEFVAGVSALGIFSLAKCLLGRMLAVTSAKAGYDPRLYFTSAGIAAIGGKVVHIYLKAPGQPTETEGFEMPKKWDGEKRKHPTTGQYGYPDRDGNIWVPTGEGSIAHGGPHWDIVDRRGRKIADIYPGGHKR